MAKQESIVSHVVWVVEGLALDQATTVEDKIVKAAELHAQWKQEDRELSAGELSEIEFIQRQKQRCKDMGMIIFGFTLHNEQADAVWTLSFECRDLLLLAKTGFGKSLIFQLPPFMSMPPGVVIVLMPLKLLQAEQNAMINRIPNGKAIALIGENNQQSTQREIATGNYTHLFTSPEIALSKKFKKNLLDNALFSERLCLLAIDEIYLVEQWGKSFWPLYAEIEKIPKRMPCHGIPLLGVSATLTKQARMRVLEKAGFLSNYKLMQTSLDRPEIM